MSLFNRGLDDAFVDALNEEYDRDEKGWWRQLVDDADTFVAIRDNYVNVYYRGCNLLKLRWTSEAMEGEVHYKYLLRPDITPEPEYVKVVDGKASLPADTSWLSNDMSDIASLKKAVQPYAGDEKTGVHDIVMANPNVIDVEIALPKDKDTAGAPRLDFAALRPADEGTKIVFFEAKHFGNQELRAKDGESKVIKQIKKYEKILQEKRGDIAESYRRVCSNLLCLHGVAEHNEMLKSVAGSPPEVDTEPVLVVFGFDQDQKDGAKWRPHRDNLKRSLPQRVLLKGDSKDFRSGISR